MVFNNNRIWDVKINWEEFNENNTDTGMYVCMWILEKANDDTKKKMFMVIYFTYYIVIVELKLLHSIANYTKKKK